MASPLTISVIIPVYNAGKTLKPVLQALVTCDYSAYEIIVVDDASTDDSVRIAQQFPLTLIRLEHNSGQAKAKNRGATQAKGHILVFVDADILVKQNTLSLINTTFQDNPDIAALTGILGKTTPVPCFFSQYKNLYMHYNFSRLPDDIDFLYTSIAAVRTQKFQGFLHHFAGAEDTELGHYLRQRHERIILSKHLEVTHLKRYTLFSFIKNDFFVPFIWAKILMLHQGYKRTLAQRRFAHASGTQLLSLLLSPLSLLCCVCAAGQRVLLIPTLCLLLCFMLLHRGFLQFLHQQKGLSFTLLSAVVNYFDYTIMALGVIAGTGACIVRLQITNKNTAFHA